MRIERLTRKLRGRSAAARFLLAAPLALFAEVNSAHHSVFANFDTRSSIEVTGLVKSVNIRNPHSQYVLDVTGEDGTSEEWLVEWSDRNALVRRQVEIDRIKVGDEITVTLWPSRRLDNVGFFVQATLADGSIFRDCGFREFREAVVNSEEFSCPEAGGDQ